MRLLRPGWVCKVGGRGHAIASKRHGVPLGIFGGQRQLLADDGLPDGVPGNVIAPQGDQKKIRARAAH